MPVKYRTLPDDSLHRKSFVTYERKHADSMPLPLACPTPAQLIPTGTLFTDDFNRPDDSGPNALGVNWQGYHGYPNPPVTAQNNQWLQITSNQVTANVINPFRPPIMGGVDYEDRTIRAQNLVMPTTVKDQYSQIIIGATTNIAGTIPGGNQGYGGSLEVLCRCNHFVTVPDNFFFESNGAQFSNLICYAALYNENYSNTGAFVNARLTFGRHDISGALTQSGIGAVTNPPFPFPRLNPGDKLRINAANSIQGGAEVVCIYVFVNDVLVARGTDFANPIPGIQFGKILTGAGGAGCDGNIYGLLSFGWPQLTFDNWEASATLPNPV